MNTLSNKVLKDRVRFFVNVPAVLEQHNRK